MRTLKPLILVAGLLMAFIAGCVPTPSRFVVTVDSLRDAALAHAKTYVLFPGVDGVQPTDLQYKEFTVYVERALQKHGYRPADDPTMADVAIFLNYGIGDPQTTTYAYSYPIFGTTGGGKTTFSASTYGSGGYSQTNGTITQQSQFGVVGTGTATGVRTTFFRYLIINAIDVQAFVKTNEVKEAWRTTVTSSGSSGDLRRVFPILIAAAQPYLASNTGQQVSVTLYESSPAVVEAKGGDPENVEESGRLDFPPPSIF